MELTIPEFVFAVLASSGLAVVAISLISRRMHARAEARSLRNRIICRLCLHAFLDESAPSRQRIITCPNCGASNEKRH
jgi:rubrerythrin